MLDYFAKHHHINEKIRTIKGQFKLFENQHQRKELLSARLEKNLNLKTLKLLKFVSRGEM